MKITQTKVHKPDSTPTVSFLQMTRSTAMVLVDLATDLSEDGVKIVRADGTEVTLTADAREALEKVNAAYDKPTTRITDRPWSDFFTEGTG